MSALMPYLALAIFPIAFVIGYINPIDFKWNFDLARQGLPVQPMPAEMSDRSDALDRYFSFLVDAIMLGSIALLAHKVSLSAAVIGLHLSNWRYNLFVGLTAAALMILVQRLLLQRVPIDPEHPFTSRVRKGSPLLWVCIFITGAFSEELWVATCLVLLRVTGHSDAASIVMTMIVFGAMHYGYGFYGASAAATKETVSALLFLHYRSLIVTYPLHFVVNMGSLYWCRYWRR